MAAAAGVGCRLRQRSSSCVSGSRPSTAAAAARPRAAPRPIWASATSGTAAKLAGSQLLSVRVVLASSMAGMVTLNATWVW
jgi:hypothetical protein